MGLFSWVGFIILLLTFIAFSVVLKRKVGFIGSLSVLLSIAMAYYAYMYITDVEEQDFAMAGIAYTIACGSPENKEINMRELLSYEEYNNLRISSLYRLRARRGSLSDVINLIPASFSSLSGEGFEQRIDQLDARTILAIIESKTEECKDNKSARAPAQPASAQPAPAKPAPAQPAPAPAMPAPAPYSSIPSEHSTQQLSANQVADMALDQLFDPKMIGANLPFLEHLTGPARTTDPGTRSGEVVNTYAVEGCDVQVRVAGGVVQSLGIAKLDTHCSFSLKKFSSAFETLPPVNQLTFGQFDSVGGAVSYTADCLVDCGNAYVPSVYAAWEGARADNFLQVRVGVVLLEDAAIDASNRWAEAMQQQEGQEWIVDRKFACSDKYNVLASEIFKSIRITSATVGTDISDSDCSLPDTSKGASAESTAPSNPPVDATQKPNITDAVPPPTIRIGDTYVYESVDLSKPAEPILTRRTVTANGPTILLTSVNLRSKDAKARQLFFDPQWNLIATQNQDGSGKDYSPPLHYYDFPLIPGKKWQQESIETNRKTGATRTHIVSGTVDNWDSVSVPAGTFQALRISLNTQVYDSSTGETVRGTDTSWYVPAIGRSVKSLTTGKDGSQQLLQLQSYSTGQAVPLHEPSPGRTEGETVVPEINGRCDDVDSIIKKAGLKPKHIQVHGPEDADAAEIGCAYRQKPRAGARVKKGSTVTYRSWWEAG